MSEKSKVVYKLWGESYEISEEPVVYLSKEDALEGVSLWLDFLGLSSVEEALSSGEVVIKAYSLEGKQENTTND